MIYIVWRFTAKPARVADFERHYGSDGTWAQLFRRSPGYHGTTLLRDSSANNKYLLWDCWDSLASFERFRQDHAADYAALDKHCEALTEKEIKLGVFETLT
ncbi:MAG: antibiotic biosynthesis monooxygenase family protein [Terriglobales bacterium]|jgi:heme-degrading monooxygenase HmoA